ASTTAPIAHIEYGATAHYFITELAGLVPLDQTHPITLALHAGFFIPLNKWSVEALAGAEYHYQELYRDKVIQPKIQPSFRFRVLRDNPCEEDNLRIFAGAGYGSGMVFGECGIRVMFE